MSLFSDINEWYYETHGFEFCYFCRRRGKVRSEQGLTRYTVPCYNRGLVEALLPTVQQERVMENQYAGMSYRELGEVFLAQKETLADLASQKKELQAKHDHLRLTVIPDKMEEDEMSSINIKGVGRLGLTLDAYVTVLAENRVGFYEWLVDSGNGGLIKPYAQPSTVKAFIKEQVKLGNEIPEDLVNCEPFYRATVTKK